jgi:prepilin-type N-terminal cleavage/methylation domain-containing protein
MKPKYNTAYRQAGLASSETSSESGFTLIELLVVLSIMVVLSTVIVINFNIQRGTRNVKIAQNEMVTNIRKAQSYLLSSRDISTNNSAGFYIIRFAPGVNSTYTMDAINASYVYTANFETFKLPQGITISKVEVDTGSGYTVVTCAQIAFRAPFGKVYINRTDPCSTEITTTLVDPAQLVTYANRKARITLTTATAQTKTVEIKGLSGTIVPGP